MIQPPNSSPRHWIKIRQELYEQVQNHVQGLLGANSSGLSRYQSAYEKEFRRSWKVSSREDLLKAIGKARIIWIGDFHALRQSQKAQLRILKSISNSGQLLIGLECIQARHQRFLDRFIQGKMTERDFLKSVEWKKNWGFPWDYYKPLFRWAQKNRVRVFGLNLKTNEKTAKTLKDRDRFSGRKIIEIMQKFPDHQLFVVYGDLHLAEPHLPAVVKKKIPEDRFLFIYQNPERIYFQLLRKEIEHQVDVVRLSVNRFCLLNVPPWVKWQNYLLYLEEHYDQGVDEDLDLTDYVARYVKVISQDLGLPVSLDHFSIATANDRGVWAQLAGDLSRAELDLMEAWIESGRSFFVPSRGVGYLGRPTVNSAAQLAMAIVFATASGQKRLPLKMPDDFVALIWLEAVQYFGSKLINPKRKTDTLNDIKATLQAHSPEDGGKESLQLALSQKMSELLYLSGSRRQKDMSRPRRKKSYLEAARILGGILGEKLHHAYRRKLFSKNSLLGLLRKSIDSDQFGNIYWEMIEVIESFPEPFQSKKEKL
jgi:hypothetical protein